MHCKISTYCILVILAVQPIFISSQSLTLCQENDYRALRALYLSTDGDNWSNNTGWPTAAFFLANPNMPLGTNINDWVGISVDSDGILKRIFLRSNNLTGVLPPELGLMCRIEEINLRSNQLEGAIPLPFWDLVSLVRIEFGTNNGFNELTGSLPPEIGQLTNLELLDLSNNEFFGVLPPELGLLTNLTELSLGGNTGFNEFSGPLPSTICNLTQLERLRLGNNLFTGAIPPCIGGFTSLIILDLGGNPNTNNFTGPIPDLSTLTNLVNLQLQNNSLTGPMPAYLASFTDLDILWLQNNQLSGCYDNSLASLCTQLNPSFNRNVFISIGNMFDAPWEDFCSTMDGACCDSPDTEDPIVSCTGDPIIEFVNTGNCDAAVINFQAHVEASMMATDNCGVAMVICSPASGSIFSIGQDNTQCHAIDFSGNTSQTCTFGIEVVPSILYPNPTTINDESCPGASDGSIDITVSDGIPPYTYMWSNGATTEDITGLSPGMYSLTVTDAIGCEVSKTIPISTIPDTEDPVVSCTGPVFVYPADPLNCSDAVVNFEADALASMNPTDNCGIDMVFCSPPSGSILPVGQSTVTCQVFDASLNSSLQCSFTIIVEPCPCPNTLQISGNVPNGIHQAFTSISSDGLISTNQDVTYKAGQEIELTAGFSVELQAIFHAFIETCN